LTPAKIEAVLDDFRDWLCEAAARGEAPEADLSATESIDLHTLLSQFSALRHEINLQTKATRAQQEQNAQTLDLLQHTLEELQSAAPIDTQEPKEADVRAQLKTLIELHDALSLGAREVQRVLESVLPFLDKLAAQPASTSTEQAIPATQPLQRPLLARLFRAFSEDRETVALRGTISELQRHLNEERQQIAAANSAAEQVRQLIDSILTGYTMSLQRLERALCQHELEPIPCVGQPFDPECMEALEVLAASGRLSSEVVDEVRRGYLWRGRVFRCAQVRVAKT